MLADIYDNVPLFGHFSFCHTQYVGWYCKNSVFVDSVVVLQVFKISHCYVSHLKCLANISLQ